MTGRRHFTLRVPGKDIQLHHMPYPPNLPRSMDRMVCSKVTSFFKSVVENHLAAIEEALGIVGLLEVLSRED